MLDDFISLYHRDVLPPIKTKYRDYVYWQHDRLRSGEGEKQREYWLNVYKNGIPDLRLPIDRARPEVFTFEGARVEFVIEKREFDGFMRLGKSEGVTSYMSYLAVLNILLAKYTGKEEILVGNVIFGRRHSDLEKVMGLFVNELALLNYPRQEITFIQFLRQLRSNCIAAFENQDYPFEELVHDLKVKRDASRNQLFDVCFAFQNFQKVNRSFEDLEFVPVDQFSNGTAKFDLTFTVNEDPGQIKFTVEYYSRIYEEATIRKMTERYVDIIRQVDRDPDIRIKDILFEFKDTKTSMPDFQFHF